MTCEIIDREDGRWFICWGKGGPPKDKKTKCVVCKRRWSTLLCDGVLPGAMRETEHKGMTYQQPEPVTCDAPLCEDCTTRPAPGVIALPDHREGWANGVEQMLVDRRKEQRARRGMKRMRDDVAVDPNRPIHVDVPADTKDFCPDCVKRMGQASQASLFPEVAP